MPDWAQEIIHNYPYLAPFGTVLGLCVTCYTVFAFVEDRLSLSVKQETTAWLKSAGDFAANQTLSFNLLRFHNKLFGDKQLSLKCLARTTLFSLTSFLLVFFPIVVKLHGDLQILFWPFFVPSFVILVLPLDFFGVAVTRKLSALAGNNVTLKKIALIFISDTLTKAVIFPIMSVCFIFLILGLMIYFMLTTEYRTFNANYADFGSFITLEYLGPLVAGLYLIFVPALLICSAWVWLYFVGLRVVRLAVFLFDVDKQPIRSIGLVGAAVLTGCYGLYTMAVGSNIEDLTAGAPGWAFAGFVFGEKDYGRAIADYNEAIRLDPKYAEALEGRGEVYAAKEDYDRAIVDYNGAIRLDPKDARAFDQRGLAYAAKEDYDRAITDYNESIRLNPKYGPSFGFRGIAYAAKQDYDSAITDYNEAIRLDPKFHGAFALRGFAYAVKEDYDRAIDDYNEAIRLDPKFDVAFGHRGIVYAAKEDYDRAIADFSEEIRLDPKSAYPVLRLYLARVSSGAQIAAVELETNAKNLKQPDWPYPVVELFLGRRTPEATFAAATKPDDRCQAKFYVGEWRLLQGDRPAGIAALKDAADTCPKFFLTYEAARAELVRLGQ